MTTITATLDDETHDKLTNLSRTMNCPLSGLVAEAVRFYIVHKEQIAAIEESIQQADAEQFASPDEVTATFAKWGVDATK